MGKSLPKLFQFFAAKHILFLAIGTARHDEAILADSPFIRHPDCRAAVGVFERSRPVYALFKRVAWGLA